MTIICAMHEAGVGTWIASDTLVTRGDARVGYKKKWIMGDGCALAVCGSSAASSLMHEHRSEFRPDWSATAFWRWAKPLLDEYGFKPKAEPGETPWYDCSFILATPTRVLSIDWSGSGVEPHDGEFASRGSGSDHADGAAWVMERKGFAPRDIVEEAVRAAIAFGNGCGGEVWTGCLRLPAIVPQKLAEAAEHAGNEPGGLTWIEP